MSPSAVIFENSHYTASAMRDGSLIVQKKRTGKGYRLIGENAAIWIENMRDAAAQGDTVEASALCRALCSESGRI